MIRGRSPAQRLEVQRSLRFARGDPVLGHEALPRPWVRAPASPASWLSCSRRGSRSTTWSCSSSGSPRRSRERAARRSPSRAPSPGQLVDHLQERSQSARWVPPFLPRATPRSSRACSGSNTSIAFNDLREHLSRAAVAGSSSGAATAPCGSCAPPWRTARVPGPPARTLPGGQRLRLGGAGQLRLVLDASASCSRTALDLATGAAKRGAGLDRRGIQPWCAPRRPPFARRRTGRVGLEKTSSRIRRARASNSSWRACGAGRAAPSLGRRAAPPRLRASWGFRWRAGR